MLYNRSWGLAHLRELPFIDRAASMDGSDGVNAVFDVEHFDAMAAIMRPKRRRRVSAEEKQRLAEIGAKYRFSAGVGCSPEAPDCEFSGAVV